MNVICAFSCPVKSAFGAYQIAWNTFDCFFRDLLRFSGVAQKLEVL